MNLRIFLTTSSLFLLGWLSASYFTTISMDGYYLSNEKSDPTSRTAELTSPERSPSLATTE